VIDSYTMESLTSDVTSIRSKVKAVKDQLQSCQDAAFRSGVAAFLRACISLCISCSSGIITVPVISCNIFKHDLSSACTLDQVD